jgi:hypothetical protein
MPAAPYDPVTATRLANQMGCRLGPPAFWRFHSTRHLCRDDHQHRFSPTNAHCTQSRDCPNQLPPSYFRAELSQYTVEAKASGTTLHPPALRPW